MDAILPMRCRRAPLALIVVVAVASDGSRFAAAANGPGTLMRWGCAPNVRGGPDLNEPLITDRPDFTESSSTVGMGVVQLEAGYTFTYDEHPSGRTNEHSFPEALWRIGMLADWFELRVAWNWGTSAENDFGLPTTTLNGAEDLYLGAKFGLTPQVELLPETALVLQANVPTGSSDLTAHEVLPGFNFAYSWEINDSLDTAGSTQVNREIDDNDTDYYTQIAQSWTVGYDWTEQLGSYAEWFAFIPEGAVTSHNQQYFNAGFTYLFTDNFQWDIRAGVGLNQAADDFFTGTGFSIRMY
jgi:Putative MetA-pathway of phenol degradation